MELARQQRNDRHGEQQAHKNFNNFHHANEV